MRKQRTSRRKVMELRRSRRVLYVGVFLCLCLVGLMYRIWYFQTVWGSEYTRLSVRQEAFRHINMVESETAPIRGQVVDRNMQPIADSQQVFTVFLDVVELQRRHVRSSTADRDIKEEVFAIIGEAFNIPRRDLLTHFETNPDGSLIRRNHHLVLARQVLPEVAFAITELVPEIHATQESLRWHHDPFFAPQVIGFSRGDADAIWGLEAFYNTELAGDPGRTVWVQGDVEEIPVRDGFTLVTTLDGDIQRLAQRYVDDTFRDVPSEFVGMIVMNPFTGEILAMAQAPTFSVADPMNPEFITDMQLVEEWDSLSGSERADRMMNLWRNYHVTRSAEPGSIFKPIVIAAAIEEGVINEHSRFYCEGRREIHDQTVWCWNRWGHGDLSLREALSQSCNMAMVQINELLGRHLFYEYRGYFGFGEYTGIDIPGEWDVSHPSVMYTFARLQSVELATSSMGQGFNTTTIQDINGFASLINGGNIMRPFIVSHIVDSHGNLVRETLPTVERRVISQQTSDFMRREMQHVVTADRGTGRGVAIPGHAIGGKTGTAQQGDRTAEIGRHTLSFITYTPVENPEFIILMTIDGYYSDVASSGGVLAPIVRRFLLDLIEMRNMQPSDGPDAFYDWRAAMSETPTMPDFSGQRLSDVVRSFNVNAGGYQVVGTGITISHHIPAPGQPMPQNAPVFFHMDAESRVEGLMTIVPDVEGLTVEQARFLLNEAGLPVSTRRSERPAWVDDDASPFTARPVPRDPDEEGQASTVYVVYRQFPAPRTEVERGTEVLLRIR